YKYVPRESRRIYNLPGRFVPSEEYERMKAAGQLPVEKPEKPIVEPKSFPPRPPIPDDGKYYIKDAPTPYWHLWGERIYLGNVNEAGDFVPDPKYPPKKPEEFNAGPPEI